MNYFGTIKILDLAHKCKNIVALHHVSTVGTNINLPETAEIPEKILPFGGGVSADWEQLVADIQAMDDN